MTFSEPIKTDGYNIQMSFADRISIGAYQPVGKCPSLPLHVCSHCNARYNAGAKFCSNCGEETQLDKKLEAYKAGRATYMKENARLNALFKQDALREAGLENHPYADTLYELAWEESHSSSLTEVWHKLQDLAERFNPDTAIPTSTVAHAWAMAIGDENQQAFEAFVSALPRNYQPVLRNSFKDCGDESS